MLRVAEVCVGGGGVASEHSVVKSSLSLSFIKSSLSLSVTKYSLSVSACVRACGWVGGWKGGSRTRMEMVAHAMTRAKPELNAI